MLLPNAWHDLSNKAFQANATQFGNRQALLACMLGVPCAAAGQGEHVAGSPCRVQISPGAPSARHSSVSGPGRRAATAACKAEFSIVLKDMHGNCCQVVQQQQQKGGEASAIDAVSACDIEVSGSEHA
jgi:hypothetical protein